MLSYFFILLSSLFMNPQSSADRIDQLSDLKWQHRIILGVVENESAMHEAVDLLDDSKSDITNRKIAYFITDGQHHQTNYQGTPDEEFWQEVVKTLDDTEDQFALIGLDGGTKARYQKLDLSQVFSLIDTMPMRQQEMRKDENY